MYAIVDRICVNIISTLYQYLFEKKSARPLVLNCKRKMNKI